MTTNVLASHGKDLSNSMFLQALADREEANRSGKLTVFYCLISLSCSSVHGIPRIKKSVVTLTTHTV